MLRLTLLMTVVLAACRTGRNYVDPVAPRWIGALPAARAPARDDTLRIVSFNIQLAERIDSALAVLTDPALVGADVILLQEMDGAGTVRIARELGMAYVYYPAIEYFKTRRDFGNAILSRWPIEDDDKVILPHRSRFGGTHRIAAAATIRIGGERLRVYSTHFGTVADMGPGSRRDQLDAIMRDAAGHDRVIIGGDMNSGTVGRHAVDAGYDWPTPHFRTAKLGQRYDHFFLRGLALAHPQAVGMLAHNRRSSDHRPIWMLAVMRSPVDSVAGARAASAR